MLAWFFGIICFERQMSIPEELSNLVSRIKAETIKVIFFANSRLVLAFKGHIMLQLVNFYMVYYRLCGGGNHEN